MTIFVTFRALYVWHVYSIDYLYTDAEIVEDLRSRGDFW